MKTYVSILLTAALFVVCSFEAPAAPRHSIAEYSYLVGSWNCTAHVKNRTIPYTTTFSWLYPEHTVLLQSFANSRGHASFMLTYNSARDDFRGIFVESSRGNATVGTWINPGPGPTGWTEHGYDLDTSGFPRASTSTFSDVTKTHYFIRDYAASSGKPDVLTQTEECNKAS